MARRSSWIGACLLAGVALAGASGRAQQVPGTDPAAPSPPSDQPPVFRSGINFVRVDVIVTDRNGRPVDDLKPADFEIVEQNAVQKIETFKLISLDGGLMASPDAAPRAIRTDLDEESEAARDDVRLFAIFLDDYHVRRESSIGVRDQVARFVETQLGPSDMVGLMYPLQPTASVRMTRNHDAVIQGIRQFEGRKFDYTPRNEYEQRYAYYPTEIVENVRNQVSMSAIKALILRMGALKEGRKALILVSEGFNAMLPPQLRDPDAGLPGFNNPARDNPDAGVGSLTESRAAFSANSTMDSDLRDIYDTANRNNTAIYTVDPRGVSAGDFGADQNVGVRTAQAYTDAAIETLRTLAFQTDGRAIVSRNDVTMGMKQVVSDLSAYYLLGYNSSLTATDGKFHEIKVRVKRPGVQVRARRGYWAFTAADAARALAPPVPELPKPIAAALSTISQPSRSRVVRTWIGTERGEADKTKVTFVWEAIPRVPGQQVRAADVPARVVLTAVAPDGSPYFRGRLPDGGGGAAAVSGRASFDVQPGPVQLRISVEGPDADVLDSEVREIVVPNLAQPGTAVGTPAVFRARTLREFQQIKSDLRAIPTAAREFSRADRILIRLPVYGPPDAPGAVAARLLNRAGQSIGNLTVAPAAEPGISDIDLLLSSFPAGEYLVEITVSGTGEPLKELIGFRITG